MAEIEIRENGAEVSAAVGDRIVLRLPENGGTGYQWSLRELGRNLEVESNYVQLPPGARPGAAGERIVTLRARSPGHATVVLQLQRPWETTSIDRFAAGVDAA
jgi:predicted secreted protein